MKKIIIPAMCFISALIIMNFASAETLSVDKNICVYKPEINKDYCKTEYIIYDDNIDIEKISLIYADFTKDNELKISDDEFYAELPGVDTEYKITEISENNYRVEIQGYKSPLLTIDNVLCYDGNCHYEYSLWNGTYNYRNAIYGNVSVLTGDTYGMIPINLTLNDSLELFWCNFTVTDTNKTVGYVYWNNYTSYICVDDDEESAVVTIIDEGNGTDYLTPETYIQYWMKMECDGTVCEDLSLYENNGTAVNTPIQKTGPIGQAQNFTQDNSKYVHMAYEPLNADTTVNAWVKLYYKDEGAIVSWANTGTAQFVQFYQVGSGRKLQWGEYDGTYESVTTTSDRNDPNWFFVTAVRNSGTVSIYINGELNVSGSADRFPLTLHNLAIGCVKDASPGTFFSGDIDNVMVWNRTLTGDEINLSYWSQRPFFINGSIEFNTTAPSPPGNVTNETYEIEIMYCYDEDHLYKKEKGINESGFFFDEYLIYCQHGCDNNTIMNFGNAGCKESDIEIGLIVIIIGIVFFSSIIWVFKQ